MKESFWVALGLSAGFLLLWGIVALGIMDTFDLSAVSAFRDPADLSRLVGPDWMHEMGGDLTALGSVDFLVLLTTAVIGYFALRGRWALAAYKGLAVGGGAIVSFGLKVIVSRPRPDPEAVAQVFTSSFPSGHAALSAVTFMTLGALMFRHEASASVRAYFIALAAAATIIVGLSRLYLGLHYPSDVLAGWLVGSAWGMFALGVSTKLFPELQKASS